MPFSPTPYIAQAIGKKSQATWKLFTGSALEPKQLTDVIFYSALHGFVIILRPEWPLGNKHRTVHSFEDYTSRTQQN